MTPLRSRLPERVNSSRTSASCSTVTNGPFPDKKTARVSPALRRRGYVQPHERFPRPGNSRQKDDGLFASCARSFDDLLDGYRRDLQAFRASIMPGYRIERVSELQRARLRWWLVSVGREHFPTPDRRLARRRPTPIRPR